MTAFFKDVVSNLFDVSVWLSPTFLTFLFGGIILQRYYVSRANEGDLIDAVLTQLNEIKADSLRYWNLNYSTPAEKEEGRILAQKIKGSLKAINSDLIFHKERSRHTIDLHPHIQELFDACTSGQFEGAQKPIDSGRYIFIVNAVNKLRSQILRRKL